MDLLLYWLPIFGGLLLGSFSLYALSIGNQRAFAWYGLLGVSCFVILFALQLGQAILGEETPATIDARQVNGPIVAIDRFEAEALRNTDGKPTAFEFRPIVKNSGPTPALNMRVSVNVTARGIAIRDDFDYPDFSLGQQMPDASILMPGQEFAFGNFKLDAVYAGLMRRKERYLFVYGWIEYDDRFEGTQRHRTEFCWIVEAFGEPDLKHGYLFFSQYGSYNCIDKGCRYAPGRHPPKRPRKQTPYISVE